MAWPRSFAATWRWLRGRPRLFSRRGGPALEPRQSLAVNLDQVTAFVDLGSSPRGNNAAPRGRKGFSFRNLGLHLACGSLALIFACKAEKPPAPKPERSPGAAAKDAPQGTQNWDPAQEPAILTFAGERGRFVDTAKLAEIPNEARGLVRVALLDDQKRPPAGKVWVANLNQSQEGGLYALELIQRGDFELFALGMGRSSKVALPEGLEPPKQIAPGEKVIVYKTAWCGVCNKVQSYLKQKGVAFVAKDIEKDKSAAAELQAKAQKAGVATGSVPIIDVSGQLMVGFDRRRLDEMLANR